MILDGFSDSNYYVDIKHLYEKNKHKRLTKIASQRAEGRPSSSTFKQNSKISLNDAAGSLSIHKSQRE